MYDESTSCSAVINNNVRSYLAMTGIHNIAVNSYQRNDNQLCLSKYYCKRKPQNEESIERTCIIYSQSDDRNFVALIVNYMAKTQTVHYQRVDSSTGLIFIQSYVSMIIGRTSWRRH